MMIFAIGCVVGGFLMGFGVGFGLCRTWANQQLTGLIQEMGMKA